MIPLLLACSSADFADEVLAAPGAEPEAVFGEPDLAANGARGGGCCAGSTDVYSLTLDGRRPELVLAFSGRVVLDGPGADLVVFENAFEVREGLRFMDPTVVSVSPDGERFVDLPHAYLADDPSAWSADPADWEGFAGIHPTLHDLDEERRARAADPESGGDRFDLADLPDGPLREEILTSGVLAVRLVPAALQADPRTGEGHPTDPISDGPDIDGVYAWSFAERP